MFHRKDERLFISLLINSKQFLSFQTMKHMSTLRDIFKEWSPRQLWSSIMIFLIAILIAKLLVFDLIWCSATSFSYLSNPLVYINIILLTFILSAPMGLFHRKWVQVGILFAVYRYYRKLHLILFMMGKCSDNRKRSNAL